VRGYGDGRASREQLRRDHCREISVVTQQRMDSSAEALARASSVVALVAGRGKPRCRLGKATTRYQLVGLLFAGDIHATMLASDS
jgi:hypothetical protein